MKKTKLTRSLLAACSIVALTAVMYGCDSGPSQSELDAAEAAAAEAAAAAAAEAEAAAAAAEAQAAAEAEAAAAAEAQAAAEAEAAAAAEAQAAADAEAAAAAEAQAAAEEEAARLKAEAAAEAAKAASASAKELLNMALPDVNVDRDTTTADVNDPVAPTVALSVSNDGMLMAEATDYSEGMAPDMIEGWRGATLMNMTGDTAVVYSDIGNDGTVTLLDRYTSNLPTATTPRTWNVGTTDAAPLVYIQWASVMRPDDTGTVMGGTASAPTLNFAGTVHGISGTFSCTGTDCVAPARFSDGTVQTGAGDTNNPAAAGAGGWTFVPDAGANLYTDDPNYLTEVAPENRTGR